MKKSLFLLPLLAGLALCGCDKGDNGGGTGGGGSGGGGGGGDVEIDESKLGPDEILGHKRVTKLEDGKSYYYAVVKTNLNGELMFLNGDEHWGQDTQTFEEKYFPFYMAESQVETEDDIQEKAAKVKVDFTDETNFTLQVQKEGAMNDGKYIGIYSSQSSYQNDVMSIHCATTLGEDFEGNKCQYSFSWLDEYGGYAIQTAVINIYSVEYPDSEPEPKFFGTGDKYVSVDCAGEDKALTDSYNLAYFYEVEAEAE